MTVFVQKFAFWARVLVLVLGLVATLWLRRELADRATPPPIPANPRRVVSLAPSVTETLYALDLGDRVVGRTRFCLYPPSVLSKPVVGGFSEVNYEAIVRLKPDLVAIPVDRLTSISRLNRLGLTTLALDTRSLSGFRASVLDLGQKLNHAKEAQAILDKLDQSVFKATKRSLGRPKPKVLFSVMRNYEGLGYVTEINAVGRDGFYDQILTIAGAENAYQGSLAFPRLSRESIVFLNPDVIVDVIFGADDLATIRRDWLSLSSVKAVVNDRIYFLTEQSDTVPGPRSYLTIDRLTDFFHPAVRETS
ncbi:MAG: helical backbone metal receptor [Deltaproteobacteria bacterium]|jgi:iron complex transport system substrate-binding protein|nr:helical backbone metal receptor [Deltaproteobacteria bacterium]